MIRRHTSTRVTSKPRVEAIVVPFPCPTLFEQPPFLIYERILLDRWSNVRSAKVDLLKKSLACLVSFFSNAFRKRAHE